MLAPNWGFTHFYLWGATETEKANLLRCSYLLKLKNDKKNLKMLVTSQTLNNNKENL